MAGGAGTDADALGGEVVDDILAGPAHERQRQNMGSLPIPDTDEIRDGGELFDGVGLDLRHMEKGRCQARLPQLHRSGKACHLGGGLRAGTEAVLLAAAGQQGPHVLHPGAEIQRPDALGPADLMGREGDHVRPQAPGGEGHLQKALDRIRVEECPGILRPQPRSDLLNGVESSQLVVHQHHADQGRVLPDSGEDPLRRDVPLAVGLHIRHLTALLGEPLAGLQNSAVLHRRRDNVPARPAILPEGGLDGPVVPLGAAGGEAQGFRRAVQGVRHSLPPGGNPLRHLPAYGVLGAGVAKPLRQHLIHGVGHLPGHRGGGGVVQVNHWDGPPYFGS